MHWLFQGILMVLRILVEQPSVFVLFTIIFIISLKSAKTIVSVKVIFVLYLVKC